MNNISIQAPIAPAVSLMPVTEEKRKRGRPRKIVNDQEPIVKRPRGRPRKIQNGDTPQEGFKRGRGRPRKYTILEKARVGNFVQPHIKKVDSSYLMKYMLDYFTKVMVLHGQLSGELEKWAPVFNRLKLLDFQMVEICKTVLSGEYLPREVVKKTDDIVAG